MNAISNRTRSMKVVLGVIAIVAVYTAIWRLNRPHIVKNTTVTISAQQIAERAAPICRLLANTKLPLEQTVEERIIMLKDGKPLKAWAVECSDPNGAHFARTIWDAQTGDLLYAIHMTNRSDLYQASSMPVSAAADIAWHWMRELGVARMGARWKVRGTPELIQNSWRVVMRTDDATATVVFDSETHNLVYINIKRDRVGGIAIAAAEKRRNFRQQG